MAICLLGLDAKVQPKTLKVTVSEAHPLIKLAQTVPWKQLADIVMPDLKNTPKGLFSVGRKLWVRIHLGVYILQNIFNKTDRQMEWEIKENAAYQLFCGVGILPFFFVPDHTKISKFRSRLTPETQRKLANFVPVFAADLGYANAKVMDIDSTVQEANMTFPTDAGIMKKMVIKAHRAWEYVRKNISLFKDYQIEVNVGKIKGLVKYYLLRSKTTEDKKRSLAKLYRAFYFEMTQVFKYFPVLGDLKSFPWEIRRDIEQVVREFYSFIKYVPTFILEGKRCKEKILSLHLKEVDCFNKGRSIKSAKYGRNFQLGRISGNFMIVGKCDTVRMEDKANLKMMVQEHQNLFGKYTLQGFAADRGYYSKENLEYLSIMIRSVWGFSLPKPGKLESLPLWEWERQNRQQDRLRGTEPLIGHMKQGGQLGRSRMKSDTGTLAAGYGAVLGFNLRQLMRHQLGKKIKMMI